MSNDSASFARSLEPQRVQLSMQFGWAIVAAKGCLDTPLYWTRSLEMAPRLFISHPKPNSGEAFWRALRRALALGDGLFPASKDAPSACPPPELLSEDLTQEMKSLLQDGGELGISTERIVEALNHWSRECWVQLSSESPILSEAASLGGSLADTYWHLSPQEEGPTRKETWRYLLSWRRLNRLIAQTRRVEAYLPENVGRLLRHSLWEWGIAGTLSRKKSGELRIAHPLRWAFLNKKFSEAVELTPEEEKTLQTNLRQQAEIWKDLISGRIPQLKPSDWRELRVITWLAYALTIVFQVALVGTLILGLLYVISLIAPWLTAHIEAPDEFGNWLDLVATLTATLGLVAPQLWRWAKKATHLYDSLYNWFKMGELKQRSLHRWNGKSKSILIIWLQELLLAKAD